MGIIIAAWGLRLAPKRGKEWYSEALGKFLIKQRRRLSWGSEKLNKQRLSFEVS